MGRFSDGFSTADSVTTSLNENVSLSETSTVLKLLLQFMHPTRLSDISQVEFEVLEPLAYAAEKYLVYSAMAICKIHIGQVFYSRLLIGGTINWNVPVLLEMR